MLVVCFISYGSLLSSGLTNDDLRETAYEILLAAAGAAGYAFAYITCLTYTVTC